MLLHVNLRPVSCCRAFWFFLFLIVDEYSSETIVYNILTGLGDLGSTYDYNHRGCIQKKI